MRRLASRQGCKRVARGKRSAAPGMVCGEQLRPERARDLSQLTNPVESGVPSGRGSLLVGFQGLRFACPWLPSRIPAGCLE
jgi:hypothetical protein